MGKSLVMTLLKRHVNIYSDLYTLCFLHSYVQSPLPVGAGPQGHDTAPSLRLPVLWYQVFGQQSKLVSELISQRHHLSGAEAAFHQGPKRRLPLPTTVALRTRRLLQEHKGLWVTVKQTKPTPESSVSSH